MKNYGKLIKEFRIRQDMSQEELANMLGLTKQAIGKWERGEASPGGQSIWLIEQLLSTQEQKEKEDYNRIFIKNSYEKRFMDFFYVEAYKRKYWLTFAEEDFLKKCFYLLFALYKEDITFSRINALVSNEDGIGFNMISNQKLKLYCEDVYLNNEIRSLISWFAEYYAGASSKNQLSSEWASLANVRSFVSLICRERKLYKYEDNLDLMENKIEEQKKEPPLELEPEK